MSCAPPRFCPAKPRAGASAQRGAPRAPHASRHPKRCTTLLDADGAAVDAVLAVLTTALHKVFGKSMENFQEMADQFLDAHAGVQVANGQQLGKVWVQLIEDNAMRERMGEAAREIAEQNRGATSRSLSRIAAIIGDHESADSDSDASGASSAGRGQKGSAA